MADWAHTTYRRIYQTGADTKWLRLPFYARTLAAELLRWADDAGCIYLASGEAPDACIVRITAASPTLAQRIAEDLAELFNDGYLVHDAGIGAIRIRNWKRAQRINNSDADASMGDASNATADAPAKDPKRREIAKKAADARWASKRADEGDAKADASDHASTHALRDASNHASPDASADASLCIAPDASPRAYAGARASSVPFRSRSLTHSSGAEAQQQSEEAEPVSAPLAQPAVADQTEHATSAAPNRPADASMGPGSGIRTSELPKAARSADGGREPDGNSWSTLMTLAAEELADVVPTELVRKLDLALTGTCAYYPKAAQIPRTWLAQRIATDLGIWVAKNKLSAPDERLARTAKILQYVIEDVRQNKSNPFDAPAPAPANDGQRRYRGRDGAQDGDGQTVAQFELERRRKRQQAASTPAEPSLADSLAALGVKAAGK